MTVASAWEIDESMWPVLLIRPKPMEMSIEELEVAFRYYDRILERRRERYAVVFDNREVKHLSAAHRSRIARYNEENEERARVYCRGLAFTITSPIVRGMMTAILWIKRPPVETRTFEELDAALSWAGEQVRDESAPLSASL